MSCCRLRDRIKYLHIYKNRRKGLGLTVSSVGFGTVPGSQDGLSISFSLLINLYYVKEITLTINSKELNILFKQKIQLYH